MSERDPRGRPRDPAGTQPKHEPEDLLPRSREPLLWGGAAPPAPPAPGTDPVIDIPRDDEILLGPPAPAAPEAAPAVRESRFSARFQFATGALLAVAVAALATVALVATRPEEQPGPAGPRWSVWTPRDGAGDGPTQIARHVGRQYRLPSGEQLVAVTSGPLEVAGLPMTIARYDSKGDIQLVDGKGLLYRLCGLGENCAIEKGKPSVQRHLLLRREALELALYSLRYVKGVDHVVVFLPPRKGEEPTQALFFRRDQLTNVLARPLSASLAPRTPTITSVSKSPDASLVQSVTTRGLFQFSLEQANQDARAFLVLKPLTAK